MLRGRIDARHGLRRPSVITLGNRRSAPTVGPVPSTIVTIRVRAATEADVGAVGELLVCSWRAAYRGLMPDEVLAGLDPVQRGEGWRQAIVAPGPGAGVHVAVDGADVVGVVGYGPSLHGDAVCGQLYAIYAAPAYWGRGVGPALHDVAIAGLEAAGFTEAVLWVLDRNERAIRFYARNGWAADGGAQREVLYGATVDEVRYRRTLAAG
jgi:GNAT superfamily N-acetyltransferase